ncbi:MAG: trimethylamine methyltransferase family protein [Clostridiales bacterium]
MKAIYSYLSKNEMVNIHKETVNYLSCIGLPLPSKQSGALLLELGAKIKSNRAYFSKKHIKDTLEKVQINMSLEDNSPAMALVKSDKKLFTNYGNAAYVHHKENETFCKVTTRDTKNLIKIVNYLDNMDYLSLPIIDGESQRKISLDMALSLSKKPILTPVITEKDGDNVIDTQKTQQVIALCLQPYQLNIEQELLHILINLISHNQQVVIPLQLPVHWLSIPLDKLILLGNIGNILNCMIAVAINKDYHFIYCGYDKSGYFPTAIYQNGNFNLSLLLAAQCQMANYYGFPSSMWVNDLRERNFETHSGCLEYVCYHSASAMTMGDMFSWPGQDEHPQCYSLENIVLDCEILTNALAYDRTFKADKKALSTDIINEIGPDSHYIFTNATREDAYKDLWIQDIKNSYILKNENYLNATIEKVKQVLA